MNEAPLKTPPVYGFHEWAAVRDGLWHCSRCYFEIESIHKPFSRGFYLVTSHSSGLEQFFYDGTCEEILAIIVMED